MDRMEEFNRLNYSLTENQLAEHFKVAGRTIRRWRAKLKENAPTNFNFPEAVSEIPAGIKINADRAIVIGDCHIPFHDPEMMVLACKMGVQFDTRTLIINGDFVDMATMSTWINSVAVQIAFRQEIDPALESIREFLKWFNKIIWLDGNHERRLAYRVGGHFSIRDFFTSFQDVEVSEYAHCYLVSGDQEIRINHQKEFARRPGSTALSLSNKFLCNIIAGHNHYLSFSFHPSGRFWCADGGHCCNPDTMHYKTRQTTTHPIWNQGFWVIVDGWPYFVNKSNAKFWLR